MKRIKPKYIGIALVVFILVTVFDTNYTVYKTCIFGGCYGPFKMVVKTTSGEHVEDIIVLLNYRTSGWIKGGGPEVYSQMFVANTDEEIIFPRGLVYWPKKGANLAMHFGFYHPDYQKDNPHVSYVTAPNQPSGVIDLGVKLVISDDLLNKRSTKRIVNDMKKRGKTQAEIEAYVKKSSVDIPGVSPSYFSYLVKLGREDLVEKYLPEKLKKLASFKNYSKEETLALEKRVRERIQEDAK